MRVYVPMTSMTLRALSESGVLDPPVTAFAVTPGLREWYSDDNDDEELEYAASSEAARSSLHLLAGDSAAARRRIVLAGDVADSGVEIADDLDLGVVRVQVQIRLQDCASIHVDDDDALETISRAAEVVDAADLGDAEAEAAVDDAEGFELCWYAISELADLLDDIS